MKTRSIVLVTLTCGEIAVSGWMLQAQTPPSRQPLVRLAACIGCGNGNGNGNIGVLNGNFNGNNNSGAGNGNGNGNGNGVRHRPS